ncbi:MAG: DNA polymerase III subunit delta [Anaerolineae bacterium]
MFYIFHGEDEFSRAEALADMKDRMGDPTWADLNTTILDGRKVTLAELIHTCDAVPFLGERRLVIVKGLLTRLEPKRGEEVSEEARRFIQGLREYLRRLPESTRLVFLEPRSLSRNNPILKLAQKDERGYVKEFKPPRRDDLNWWITQRVKGKGGDILPGAVTELAAFVGNDLRLLDQEIEKLITYVGGARAISTEDVHLLVSYAQEANVFQMVDALGRRDRRRAITLLHELLDSGQAPAYLLYMITRQFRILMQIKELSQGGASAGEIKARLGLHPFVVDKGLEQARNFSMGQLEAIYGQLLEADTAMKTGRTEPALALDLLIVGLTTTRPG